MPSISKGVGFLYKRITVPVDNSEHASHAVDIALGLAERFGSYVCGSHVYASQLHDRAFRRMEQGLPQQYQQEDELARQRRIHDSLIDRGLNLISESMLDEFLAKARERRISAGAKVIEGKNFAVLLNDIKDSAYDLVVIGAHGLGRVERSLIGSVCERVCRDTGADVLVVKKLVDLAGARILCAVDGSAYSYSALKRALDIAKTYSAEVTAVHVFDPMFHTVAFNSIAQVLTDEAAQVFKFEEQQKLHDEIIDRGLKRVGERHLERARRIAGDEGVPLKTVILAGKPYDQIIDLIEKESFDLIVTGRFGTHYVPESSIGSHTYNILLFAPCNQLIVSRIDESVSAIEFHGSAMAKTSVTWNIEAEERLGNIPPFVRGMVKKSIEEFAVNSGYELVTPAVMDEARKKMGF